MHIVITNTSALPIYEQIKQQIKQAILSNEVKEGEQLPSIRQLAQDLRVSVITTMRAYNELEQESYVANVQGKGCFVLEQSNELMREEKLRQTENHLLAAIETAHFANISHVELMQMLEVLLEGNVDA